ncbi:hypothetical protein OI790_001710, partial [Campylobacter upsaliensis]|nr:hypothetical protein [Campylobacter upsaliensis]
QEEIYQAQEANNLKDILEAEEKPLKDEFGINFEGFKGKEAIEKLLEEQRGQVKGAFYKEGLGEIDLVWGDENFGLRHIIEQRTKQWGEEKALKFISHLNENIEKGQIVEVQKGRAAIKTDLTTIILDKKENNNFVLTAFRDRNNKKELESLNLSQSKTFTSENAEANAKESPVTSLNQESIIAQNAKNDEVLEAEVIEEVGLNEPMKFLEFQQRKLLTYIKENTPLRLLEHKKELKTRDILNFLEQSALNGKQKVFLMRNLERDLEKLEAQLKEAEEVGFKEAKNAVDDDFLKGYDEKIKQNIKSLEFENELIENPRPRGREPQDRYISLAYFMANFAQHYKLLDLKNPRTKEQIELLENALKKQNIGYEVLENEPVAIRYFKKEGVKRQGAKQKTINKVDEYAKSEEFKALSEDKQEAILSLKNLEPSIMPSEISKDNLENILKHFNSKQDKARREFYAKLFNDTKENPHIVLEVKRENELRQEYIKAYQHKDTHDLYYIAITKDKDTINVTGYPITKIKDVINQIKNAEKVVWRQQGDQTHTALVSKETQNLESVNESIAQNGIKDDKQAFLQFIKIMQDTKNGDFYPSENLQNALEKSGKKARENALELFIKEYESKDAKLVELLKNIQEPRIASKALSLIKHFTQARMMQSAIKAVPSDILMKYVNIDASQRLEVLSSLYGDFSNIMKEVALKGKKIPDPAALSEKGGAYVFNRQYRKILNIYEKIQENEELLRLLAHKNDYKTTIEIIQESKAKGLSVKQTKEAIEENKKQTAKLFDEVIRQENKPSVKPLDEFGINFEGFKGKEAIEKLLEEQRGQVKGAFYKEGLGEIDLVWGDSKKGLSHILERKTQDFINQGLEKGKAEYKVRELLSEIPQILENGKILSQNNDKIELITDKYTLVLGLREDKKFIVTELIDKRNKKRLEAMQTGVGDSFTDEPLAKTPLSQNQQEIIPQQKIK